MRTASPASRRLRSAPLWNSGWQGECARDQTRQGPCLDRPRRIERGGPEIRPLADRWQVDHLRDLLKDEAEAGERYDTIVLSDSDIVVGPNYLRTVTAMLSSASVGAVTCLYYGVAVGGIWARLSALAINAHFLPSVVLGLALGLARPCFGSTLAFRRKTLGEIGGFTAFVDCLADDYAIGTALRARGYKIAIPPFATAHMCTQMSLPELWQHELRWARTIRTIDPVGYAGSMIAHPLPWALIAVLVGGGSAALLPAIGIAVASIASRMALLRQVEQTYALPIQAYWLVPARDLLSFALFVLSFFGRQVSWKGRRYRMASAGSWLAGRGLH